jgi:hypothetical protein
MTKRRPRTVGTGFRALCIAASGPTACDQDHRASDFVVSTGGLLKSPSPQEHPESAPLARCRAFRRRSPNLTESDRPGRAAGTAQFAPQATFDRNGANGYAGVETRHSRPVWPVTPLTPSGHLALGRNRLILGRSLFGLPVGGGNEPLQTHPADDLFQSRVVAARRHEQGAHRDLRRVRLSR